MVIYSSAPRASIDGAWESRFDTVRSYSLLSESGVRDPSGIFTFLYRSLFLKPVDDPSFPFQFLPPRGTPSFRVSPSTFMVSLELTSSIFQDSSRERIFLYGLVQSLKITSRRKRANWKVNIILREKVSNFIIIYLRIEKFLDRSAYVRGEREGILGGEKCSDTRQLGSLSPGRIAGGCDLLHFLESTAGQHIVSHARFTWMY